MSVTSLTIWSTTGASSDAEADIVIWEPHPGDYVELLFGLSQIIITILQCVLISLSIRSHNVRSTNNNKNSSKPYTLRLAIVVFVGYLISSVIGITQAFAFFFDSSAELASVLCNVHSILQSGLITALYAFMALRVHQTFGDTAYRVSNCTFIIHTVNIICVSVGVFFFATIVLKEEVSSWFKIMFVILVLVPFVIGLIHLIYLFNARLFALFLLKQNGVKHTELNGSQRRLLNTVRKHTVLGAFIVMAQVVTMVHAVLLYGVIDLYSTTGYISYWIICNLCIIIETLCLFAGFSKHGNMYLKLCSHCDRGCDRICVLCVRRGQNQKMGISELKMVQSMTVSVIKSSNASSEHVVKEVVDV